MIKDGITKTLKDNLTNPTKNENIQGLLGPLLASFIGGSDKADVASLAKQAGNVSPPMRPVVLPSSDINRVVHISLTVMPLV